jgi:hypothetical protein
MMNGCFGKGDVNNENNCSPVNPEEIEKVWEITGDDRTFSSPHAADLTGDGILDIVFGTGIEMPPKGSIIAVDGNDGTILWRVETTQEMFASAQFEDLDGDGELDVILGGRGHELRAIDGQTGELIWMFDSNSSERENWYQFYTGQFIDDINDDGISDWLTTNGGDPTKTPEEERDGGYLMVLSGSNGTILAVANTPDGMETYVSPIVYKDTINIPEETKILFGTGGETWHGSLWLTTLNALMNGNISDSLELVPPVEGIEKGVISPPVIVDLTMDGIQDIVVSMFDGRTIALNGEGYSTIWEVDAKEYALDGTAENAETWVTPGVGFFSDDSIPDIFIHYLIGEWPQYSSYWTAQIDGVTGDVSWMEETDHVSAASPLAVDLNNDGIDEVIMIRGTLLMNENNPNNIQLSHELLIWNSCDYSNTSIFNRDGLSIASPLIIDIDNDGHLDMITTSTSSFDSPTSTWKMYRDNLNIPVPTKITWGAYMGTHYNGIM